MLGVVAERFAFVHEYVAAAAARARFEDFVRALLRPALDEIGFAAAAGEDDERRSMRGVADSGPRLDSRRFGGRRAIASGAPTPRWRGRVARPPPPPRRLWRSPSSTAMPTLFDALLRAARRSVSPDEHDRYLHALPRFRDPALIVSRPQYARSSEVRSQDAALYFGSFFANPAARTRAWSFLKEHWAELEPKVTIAFGDVRLVSSLSAFCDAPTRDDIRAFFAVHELPSARRTLDQTIERIDNCIAVGGAQTDPLARWLDERSRQP